MHTLARTVVIALVGLLVAGCSNGKMSLSCLGAKEVKWHHDGKVVQLATQSPASAPGMSLGLVKIEATAKAPGDNVPTPADWAVTFEYDHGSGPHRGLITYRFTDGSTLVLAIRGTTTVDAGGASRINGTATVHNGTGKYAHAHGGGSYTGIRTSAIGEGATLSVDVALRVCMK